VALSVALPWDNANCGSSVCLPNVFRRKKSPSLIRKLLQLNSVYVVKLSEVAADVLLRSVLDQERIIKIRLALNVLKVQAIHPVRLSVNIQIKKKTAEFSSFDSLIAAMC